ncbi:MAG: MFS transporter [Lachnospiraceae bacterium]|nr:MFS transporter [Lachnospiraceae bacterium]
MQNLNIVLDKKQRNMAALAAMFLYMNTQSMNYAINIVSPSMLSSMDGMKYYSLVQVISATGIMITAPVAGKLSDQLGRKWLTLGALFAHQVFLLLMATSGSPLVYMGFYAAASLCNGLYTSAAFAIIGDIIPMEERSKYVGFLSASGAIGCMLGPVLCGLIVDSGYFRFSYGLGVPLGVIAAVLLLRAYPNVKGKGKNNSFDSLGLALLVGAVSCFACFVSLGGTYFMRLSPAGLGLIGAFLIAGTSFFIRERRCKNPIVDLSLFQYRQFALSWIVRLLFTAYLSAVTAYGVLLGQQVMGISATVTSTFMIPQTVIMVFFSPVVGRLLAKNQRNYKRFYFVMGSFTCAALLMFSRFSADTPLVLVYLAMAIGGVAYASEQTVSTPYFQMAIPATQYGAAQGMSFFASSAGGVIAGAVYASTLSGSGAVASGIQRIFLTGAGVMCIIIFLSLFLIKRDVIEYHKTE